MIVKKVKTKIVHLSSNLVVLLKDNYREYVGNVKQEQASSGMHLKTSPNSPPKKKKKKNTPQFPTAKNPILPGRLLETIPYPIFIIQILFSHIGWN